MKLIGIAPNLEEKLLLKNLQHNPKDFLNSLNSEFGFAVKLAGASDVFAARGIFGEVPCYYLVDNGQLFFANSIPKLINQTNYKKNLNEEWLIRYLNRADQDIHQTAYLDIKRLPPGYMLKFKDGKLHITNWLKFPYPKVNPHLSMEKYAELLEENIIRAVKDRLPSTGNVAFELSGGLDSTLVCAIAIKLIGTERIRSYSHVNNDEDNKIAKYKDERKRIKDFVNFYGIHNELIDDCNQGLQKDSKTSFQAIGQPHIINTVFYNHRIFEKAKESGCKVIFSGFGGDEGITFQAKVPIINQLIEEKSFIPFIQLLKSERPKGWLFSAIKHVYNYYMPKSNSLTITNLNENLFLKLEYRRKTEAILRRSNTFQATEDVTVNRPFTMERLEESNLTAQAYGLKYEFPLWDMKLIQFYLSIPAKYKMYKGIRRSLPKLALKSLLPESISQGDKEHGATVPNAARRHKLTTTNTKLSETKLVKYLNAERPFSLELKASDSLLFFLHDMDLLD